MKVGDEVFCEVSTFFDIQKVKIIRETPQFFVFKYNNKEIRRKKNRFNKNKLSLLEEKLKILSFNLAVLKTTPQEIFEAMKIINEEYPEILI
jgi:hypothetical protein